MTIKLPGVALAELVEVVKSARVVDLAHDIFPGMPVAPTHVPYTFTLARRHGDLPRDDGVSTANELVVMAGHTGTHIDALGHASRDGRLFGGVSVDLVQTGGRGLREHGVERLPLIAGRGVLLDVAGLYGVPHLEPGHEITAAELETAQERAGVAVSPGDSLLIRTGWGGLWSDRERFVGERTGTPGPGPEAVAWMVARGITVTGSDTLFYEAVKPDRNTRPVHGRLLVDEGIPIIEALNLEALAEYRAYAFLFIASPLKLVGATGAPIQPVAVVPTNGGHDGARVP